MIILQLSKSSSHSLPSSSSSFLLHCWRLLAPHQHSCVSHASHRHADGRWALSSQALVKPPLDESNSIGPLCVSPLASCRVVCAGVNTLLQFAGSCISASRTRGPPSHYLSPKSNFSPHTYERRSRKGRTVHWIEPTLEGLLG